MPIRERKQRIVTAAEVLLVALALWLAGSHLAMLKIPGWAGAAVVLVVAVWIIVTAVELGFFFAISWDDSRDLLIAGVRAGAVAMWFVPAIVLLGMEEVAAQLAGLLLAANTMRLLMSRNAPQRLAPQPPPSWTQRYRILRHDAHQGAAFRRETLPAIAGAVAVQGGICGLLGGYVMPSAALAVAGSAAWTWVAIRRGAAERRRDRTQTHWLLSVVLTLLLSLLLTAAGIRTEQEWNARDSVQESDVGTQATLEKLWQELERPERKPAAATKHGSKARSKATKMMGSGAGDESPGGGLVMVPGVIVRPETPAQQPVFALFAPRSMVRGTRKVERPTTFPFTGEYRVFPTSSAGRKHEWAVENGTLIENRYETSGGGELETIAEQSVSPPLDFSGCGRVSVLVKNEEDGPFTAALQLLTSNGAIALNSEIAGVERRDELLEFDVPANVGLVRGMHLVFHRLHRRDNQSLRINVQQFTLEPRGQ